MTMVSCSGYFIFFQERVEAFSVVNVMLFGFSSSIEGGCSGGAIGVWVEVRVEVRRKLLYGLGNVMGWLGLAGFSLSFYQINQLGISSSVASTLTLQTAFWV